MTTPAPRGGREGVAAQLRESHLFLRGFGQVGGWTAKGHRRRGPLAFESHAWKGILSGCHRWREGDRNLRAQGGSGEALSFGDKLPVGKRGLTPVSFPVSLTSSSRRPLPAPHRLGRKSARAEVLGGAVAAEPLQGALFAEGPTLTSAFPAPLSLFRLCFEMLSVARCDKSSNVACA